MFWGIWEGFVTKLVHRAYSRVRPLAINTTGSSKIGSCALLCGALVAIVLKVGEGDAFDMTSNTSLYDFLGGFTVEPSTLKDL